MTIGNSVTTIGNNAFAYCSSLPQIEIPASVTLIDNSAFYYCRRLMKVKIAGSHKSLVLGDRVFTLCAALTQVTLPSNMTALGKEAFAACTGLTDVICLRPRPFSIDASVFKDVPVNGGCDLHVPIGSKVRYQAMDVWKDFLFISEDAETEDPINPDGSNGDVNGDGVVDIADVARVIDIVLGK